MTTPRLDWHLYGGLALALTAGLLLYLLGPILTPFLLAAILAYLGDPLADRLERHKVPRGLATVLVMLLLLLAFAGFVLILVPLLEKEFHALGRQLPAVLDWLHTRAAPWFQQRFGLDLSAGAGSLEKLLAPHWQSAGGAAASLLPTIKTGGLAVVEFVGNAVLVPVVTFYLLRDWDRMVAHIDQLVPRRWQPRVATLAREVDRVLAEFLRGQVAVMLLMAIYYVAALWLAGLDYALPVGMMAGLLVFIPYLGMITGLTLATVAGLLQFHGLAGLIPVWIAFAIGQVLEGMVVTPWLVGERIGLHPVLVIFALLAFGQLFGFFGILLALPASAALLVGLRHLRQRYLASSAYLD